MTCLYLEKQNGEKAVSTFPCPIRALGWGQGGLVLSPLGSQPSCFSSKPTTLEGDGPEKEQSETCSPNSFFLASVVRADNFFYLSSQFPTGGSPAVTAISGMATQGWQPPQLLACKHFAIRLSAPPADHVQRCEQSYYHLWMYQLPLAKILNDIPTQDQLHHFPGLVQREDVGPLFKK